MRPLPIVPVLEHRPPAPSLSSPKTIVDQTTLLRTEAIIQSVRYHAELVSALDSVNEEHALAELRRLHILISELENDIQRTKTRLAKLADNRNRTASQKQDSTGGSGRRFSFSLVGKKKKQAVGKTHAIEASQWKDWQEEAKAKEDVNRYEERLVEYYASRSRFQRDKEKAELLWTQLDALYDPIFAGSPGGGYSEEFLCAQRVREALAILTDLEAQQTGKSRALEYLKSAENNTIKLNEHLNTTLPCFSPLINGGSSQSALSLDRKEQQRRQMLEQATEFLRETQDMLSRAQLIQPDVMLLPIDMPAYDSSTSPQRSNLIYAQLMTASEACSTGLSELHTKIFAQTRLTELLEAEKEGAEKELREARTNLRKIRRIIFERVVTRGPNTPPEYEEWPSP